MANLFGNATPGTNTNQNAGAPGITTGTRLRFAVAATITAVRWRCPDTAPAAASWIVVAYVPATDSAGSGLGSGSFGTLTAGAWNTASCSIAVNAGDEIVVEVWNSEGRYVNETGYFASDVVVGNLTGPADDSVTPKHNGRFNIGGSITFPTDGFAQNAYFVDVEYTASGTTWPVTQTDSAGLTDSITLNRTSAATDTTGITDAIVLSRTSTVTDPIGLTDTYALSQAPTATDTAGLTDSITLGRSPAITDTVGLTDGLVYTQRHSYTDTTGLTDLAAVQGGPQRFQEWTTGPVDAGWVTGPPEAAWAAGKPETGWMSASPEGGDRA